MNAGVQTAQGRAWNYVSAEDMLPVRAVIVLRAGKVETVNNPNGVHLRANGHEVTVKGFDSSDTVTLDYRRGDSILAVTNGYATHDVRLSNFYAFAPRGVQTIHLCALNNVA